VKEQERGRKSSDRLRQGKLGLSSQGGDSKIKSPGGGSPVGGERCIIDWGNKGLNISSMKVENP